MRQYARERPRVLASDTYGLVGIAQYENTWRMAYVPGPEGIIVSPAERIG